MTDEIPAYVDMKRLCKELGRSDETIRRWQKRHGFPLPRRFGLFEWKEVKAFMDGRGRRGVPSPSPTTQIEEIQRAHQAYTQAGRSR
jgi:predicted DNA-binding transcriptional regulator AlpA